MTKLVDPEEVFSPAEIKQLLRWISSYGNPLLFFLRDQAEAIFRKFDRLYFERTGLSEEAYLTALVEEARREASLRFTAMPNGANTTMFHYPEEQRAQEYKKFETEFIRKRANEENRLRFKAYVARRFGLRVPLRS